MMAMPALPKLIQHCTEHIIALYEKHSMAASMAAQVSGLSKKSTEDAQAEGVMLSEKELIKIVGPMMEHLTKLAEMAKQLMPPPPEDPAIKVATMQIQAEDKREGARLAQDKELKTAQMQGAQQKDMMTLQGKAAGEQAKQQGEASRHTEEMAIAAENARIAEQSEQRAQQFNAMIAQMREDAATERQEAQQQFTMALESMKQEQAQVLEVLRQGLATQGDAASQVVAAELQEMYPQPTTTKE
jgi:hypothetical protein